MEGGKKHHSEESEEEQNSGKDWIKDTEKEFKKRVCLIEYKKIWSL